MSLLPVPPASRLLGRSGIAASGMAWGMMRYSADLPTAVGLANAAIDAGLTLFDTADIYGFDGQDGFGRAEALLGQAMLADRTIRDRIILATKGGICPPLPYDNSPSYLAAALDASLTRLGVEQVDLYQIHRPDMLTHPLELVRFADNAFAAGKIRAFGISNFHPAQTRALVRLLDGAALPLATIQPEISPLAIEAIEDRTLAIAMEHELTPLAWSPLGGGRIAEPVSRREQAVAAALDDVARPMGISRAAAACSWLMAHPAGIIPIVGTQNPVRMAELAQARRAEWTRRKWYAVLVAARGAPLP